MNLGWEMVGRRGGWTAEQGRVASAGGRAQSPVGRPPAAGPGCREWGWGAHLKDWVSLEVAAVAVGRVVPSWQPPSECCVCRWPKVLPVPWSGQGLRPTGWPRAPAHPQRSRRGLPAPQGLEPGKEGEDCRSRVPAHGCPSPKAQSGGAESLFLHPGRIRKNK